MKFRKIKSPATKTIEFKLHESIDERVYTLPVPAETVTPEWFLDMPVAVNNEALSLNPLNYTSKTDPRFSDTFSLGYLVVTPYDVEITQISDTLPEEMKNNPTIGFKETPVIVFGYPGLPIFHSTNYLVQAHVEPLKNAFSDIPYSWSFWFSLQTPPGYSVLITNPLNVNNLPWHTSSLVIDSDKEETHVSCVPFYLPNPSEYKIIPKGTPIAQIIPFKRDSWTRKMAPITGNNLQTGRSSVEPIRRQDIEAPNKYYTNHLWNKKTFS